MQLAAVRSVRTRFILVSLFIALPFSGPVFADPANSDYEGWLFETGLLIDNTFTEEQCFGQLSLPIAADLNWAISLSDEVCWGRTTTNTGRTGYNFPPFNVDNFEGDQSTRPLISAGGNMYEMYGQEFEGGVGQGEERFGAMLSAPSNDNLVLFGSFVREINEFGGEYFRSIGVLVKATAATQAARTAADLEGTTWRIATYTHELQDTDINVEFALSTILTLGLQTGGNCTYSNSTVFPDFVNNGDVYRAFQFDDGVSFDDRAVQGGPVAGVLSDCTWSIDADDYLSVTQTLTSPPDPDPEVLTARLVVSDDNRHFALAPSVVTEDSSRSLTVGYRAASGLATNAIDGTYLFYLALSEFGADGTGAQVAGPFGDRNWQELDVLGRGKLVFNSATAGTTPAGETGTWYSCEMEAVFGDNEHEFTGSTSTASVALGQFSSENDNVVIDDCDYQLQADGGLRVYVFEPDGEDPEDDFETILRGYVNDNGEILALTANGVEGDPGNPTNVFEDLANVLFVLGMKYTGDPDADADGDGITNLREFQIPLPAQSTRGDLDGDGKADILWRNVATGENYFYQMNGATIQSAASINLVSDLNWKIVGNGDLNGDGKADVVWRNTTTGENYFYLMNGATIESSGFINLVSDLNWTIVGNGDMNGDGKADLLWRNVATGENYFYQMNGATIQSAASINVISDQNWTVVGNGDMNGDGKADIVWRNIATGENYLYLMNGATIQSSGYINLVSDLNWTIVGNGDLNGDGKADIVWRNVATGENYFYLMNGSTIQSGGYINLVTDLNWTIVGNNDMNGDGKADILWRNVATGENYFYQMNGATIVSSASINLVPDLNWQISNTR